MKLKRIEILINIHYGKRKGAQNEVCEMFNVNTLIQIDGQMSQSTVSVNEWKFREVVHVRDLPGSGRPTVTEDKKV